MAIAKGSLHHFRGRKKIQKMTYMAMEINRPSESKENWKWFEKYRTIHFARHQIRKTCRGSNQAKGNTHTKILTGTGRSPRIRLPPSLQHDSSIFDIFFSSSLLFLVSLYISHDLFKKRSVRNDECWPPWFYSHFKVDNLRPTRRNISARCC